MHAVTDSRVIKIFFQLVGFRFHIAPNLLRNYHFIEFWCNIKEEYLQQSEKGIEIFLPFSTTYQYKASYPSSKTIYCGILSAEADLIIYFILSLIIKRLTKM